MNNITDDEIAMLEAAQSAKDWNDACASIKKARNGLYPRDWWPRVLDSGLCRRVSARWGGVDYLVLAPLSDMEVLNFFGQKNSRNDKGFTLGELMIVVLSVFVFASVIVADKARKRAEYDATNYIHELHPEWTEIRAVCQSTDSDGDGYVSCTATAKGSADALRELPLECRHSVFFNYARGCRPLRVVVNTRSGYEQR
jgi:hypothetical protein